MRISYKISFSLEVLSCMLLSRILLTETIYIHLNYVSTPKRIANFPRSAFHGLISLIQINRIFYITSGRAFNYYHEHNDVSVAVKTLDSARSAAACQIAILSVRSDEYQFAAKRC